MKLEMTHSVAIIKPYNNHCPKSTCLKFKMYFPHQQWSEWYCYSLWSLAIIKHDISHLAANQNKQQIFFSVHCIHYELKELIGYSTLCNIVSLTATGNRNCQISTDTRLVLGRRGFHSTPLHGSLDGTRE